MDGSVRRNGEKVSARRRITTKYSIGIDTENRINDYWTRGYYPPTSDSTVFRSPDAFSNVRTSFHLLRRRPRVHSLRFVVYDPWVRRDFNRCASRRLGYPYAAKRAGNYRCTAITHGCSDHDNKRVDVTRRSRALVVLFPLRDHLYFLIFVEYNNIHGFVYLITNGPSTDRRRY